MIQTTSEVFDVFLSYAASDRHAADEIADSLRSNQLVPFTHDTVASGADLEGEVWRALGECRAVLVLLGKQDVTANMWFEIGAARAWNKPIYAVVQDLSAHRLPAGLAGAKIVSQADIDDVISRIRQGDSALAPDEMEILRELYAESGISTDQLAIDSAQLSLLAEKFEKRTSRRASNEVLLSSLLRLRKRGELPALRRIPKRK